MPATLRDIRAIAEAERRRAHNKNRDEAKNPDFALAILRDFNRLDDFVQPPSEAEPISTAPEHRSASAPPRTQRPAAMRPKRKKK